MFCLKISSTYGRIHRKPQRWLHVDEEISKRRQHTISSVRLEIEISKMRSYKLKLVLRYNHPQTLCPRPFWPLRYFLKSFAIKLRLCEPVFRVSFNLFVLSSIQINETIEATKLQLLTKDSMEQQWSADGEQSRLVNYFWKQLYFKNFILTSKTLTTR